MRRQAAAAPFKIINLSQQTRFPASCPRSSSLWLTTPRLCRPSSGCVSFSPVRKRSQCPKTNTIETKHFICVINNVIYIFTSYGRILKLLFLVMVWWVARLRWPRRSYRSDFEILRKFGAKDESHEPLFCDESHRYRTRSGIMHINI